VTAVAGDVDFTMAGNAVTVAPDTTVLLPARIVTGRDGNVGLTQAGTNVNVANDTDVEIPAEAVDGNLIARLVQHRGNVFYDVAPRDLGKLRVETPFLVAVIKGTQFNVAVDEDGTTISLFEGSLEIRTPDDSDIIELNAGEIAMRSLIDDSIRVIGMDDVRVALPPSVPLVADDAAAATPPPDAPSVAGGDAAVDAPKNSSDGAPSGADASGDTAVAAAPPPAAAEPDATGAGTVETPIVARNEGADVGRPFDVALDIGSGAVGNRGRHAGQDRERHAGRDAVDVGLDTNVELGGGPAIDLVVDAAADLGPGVDVDPGVDPLVDTRSLDLALDAVLDGDLDVDLAVELEVALGDVLDLDLVDDTPNLDLDPGVGRGAGAQKKPEPSRGVHGRLLGVSQQL
jgi:hypothetical protein